LPYNGIVNGTAGMLIPDNSGFSLIGDAKANNGVMVFFQCGDNVI